MWDREEHERRLVDPQSYRPVCCHCGRPMQGHGLRDRRHVVGLDIRRYRCRRCRAVVQVLPAFVARNLWRLWRTVESAVVTPERAAWTLVPARTLRG